MEEPPIQFRVLGCYGAREPGCNLASFLINGSLLVEAGSAASTLTIDEQARLSGIVLTHAHLDHVAEIPYLADNIFGKRESPLPIISVKSVLEDLHKHIFNNVIWPDFTAISSGNSTVLKFVPLKEGEEHRVGDIRLTAHPVSHKVRAVGYIFRDRSGSLLYTGDTGPTEAIWQRGHELSDLRAIITEVSFPNKLQDLAEVAKHLTPATLYEELGKMPPGVPVYLFHEKAQFREELLSELNALGDSRLRFLVQGETYEF